MGRESVQAASRQLTFCEATRQYLRPPPIRILNRKNDADPSFTILGPTKSADVTAVILR